MNSLTYENWRNLLKSKFAQGDEYYLADAIYPFFEDYHHGKSPQESFEDFDLFVCGEPMERAS